MYLPTQVKLTVPDGGLIRMTMYNVVASCCSITSRLLQIFYHFLCAVTISTRVTAAGKYKCITTNTKYFE